MTKLCIGLASGLGAGNAGCGDAPFFLQKNLSLAHCKWGRIVPLNAFEENKYGTIGALNRRYAEESFAAASQNSFFLGFGGDHSCGLGMWSGVAEAKRHEGDIGLIWIDAHMDAHTKETSESGNIHGMPLASLLGYGEPEFTKILSPFPKIKPQNVVIIGARSYENPEVEFLEQLNVRVYYIDEVFEKGLLPILEEVTRDLRKRTVGYGVSFDLDAIDPLFVQATGTLVPGGIAAQEAIEAADVFVKTPPLAFELVEYNPSLDGDRKTLTFIQQLLTPLMKIPSQQTVGSSNH